MKFILFNVQDIDKVKISKIQLYGSCCVNEITFSKKVLEELKNEPKCFFQRLKYKYYDMKIDRIIFKALENHDKKWYYILSKDMMISNKYLNNKFQQLLGCKLSNINEMDCNIFKYIDEYVNENEQIKSYELKLLLVGTNTKNININLLPNLIKEYKCVNIYLKELPSEYILKRIKEINKNEGTTIEILKKERKSFIDYDVIYFVDDYRVNYPRLRFNKNAKIIDLEQIKEDKYNSNIIYLNGLLNEQKVNVENIKDLKVKYNCIELAQVIKKSMNVLDK